MKILRRVNLHWVIGLSFAFLSAFWIVIRLPTTSEALLDADGGHQLAGALQILHGEHPFVDYRATYGPLTFYASALAQIIFGQRFIGELALNTFGYMIGYGLLALLMYQITGRAKLVFFAGLLALCAIPRLYKYYIVLGPVLTVWFAWCYIQRPKRMNIFWLALAVTIAGLFRSDFGVYCTIAATLAVVLQPSYKAGAFKRALMLWGAIFVCALPYLLFLAFNGGLGDYFADMLVGGPSIAAGMSLPFPAFYANLSLFSPQNLIFISTLFFSCFPFLVLLFLLIRWKFIEEHQRKILLIAAILYTFSLLQAFARIGYLHILQAIPLAFLLAGWLMNRLWMNLRSSTFKLVHLLLLLSLCTVISTPIFLVSLSGWSDIRFRGIPAQLRQFSLPKDQMIASAEPGLRPWYVETMQYIRRCTTGRQRLLSLPLLTSIYYFTDRPFGGGQMLIVSGYFVREADQQRMVAKMKEDDIPLIVYMPDLVFDGLPERKLELVAPTVASYIQANYRLLKVEGQVNLLLRNDLTIRKQGNTLNHFSCPVAP